MENTVDLLKIKIEKAKTGLSEESQHAIDAIDWKGIILGMRAEKGYSYTQLEDLEIETELLLCGLINPEDYPKELEKRMNIPRAQVDILVNEMNERVFKKIREELVKNIEIKKISENKQTQTSEESKEQPLESREEMLKHLETPDLLAEKELPAPSKEELAHLPIDSETGKEIHPILAQKLSGSFQIPTVETEHSLTNMTKDSGIPIKPSTEIPKVDPYRMPID
ncbi:MAG: hypothetical protein WC447_02675 [Candidatus Paceibacterota bacterium]|jgi:hypothetical protein